MLGRLSSYVSSRNLGPKLFLSHFLVALTGILTVVAVSLTAPVLFGGPGLDGGSLGWTLFYLFLAGLSATVTATAASLFVSGRIVGPVRHMLAATRRISAGRYSERVPIAEDDELGALSESFNAMASALEETERERREFVADVSHELRTPLSTLQGYLEGLIDGVVEPSEESWGMLYAEAERMRRLVDDLQQLSRAEARSLPLDVAPVPPEEPVRVAVESMLPLFSEKGVELARRAPQGLPPVLADADRVVQVLTNLLVNALRYTPKGGRVRVEIREGEGGVVFSVEDTGAGMSPEHLSRVFERFYRVEKSRSREGGGSGLGLAISRALVEAMDGTMRAESAGPGRGATFAFKLPASTARS